MKKILFLFALIASLCTHAQQMQKISGYGFQWNRGEFTVFLTLPERADTLFSSEDRAKLRNGSAFFNTTDSTIWLFYNSRWRAMQGVGGGGGSTETLTNVGGGAELVKTLSGSNYPIRTIPNGLYINWTTATNTVTANLDTAGLFSDMPVDTLNDGDVDFTKTVGQIDNVVKKVQGIEYSTTDPTNGQGYVYSSGTGKMEPTTLSAGAAANANVGSQFRWLNPGTQELRTYAVGWGHLLDSTSTSNALTSKADTGYRKLATQDFLERNRREYVDNISGQVLIWDLTDATQLTTSSGKLVTVNDLGTGNNDINIVSSGDRPSYHSSGGANNKPYVQVESGKTFGVSSLSLTTTPATFYVVCQLPNLTDAQRVFGYDGTNGPVIETERLYIYTAISPFYSPDHRPAARTQWMVLKVIMKDLDGLGMQVNHEPEIYSDGASNTTLDINELLFDYCDDIKVSEVRVFNRLVTEAEDDRLQLYFQEKYKLKAPERLWLLNGDSHTFGTVSGTTTTGGNYVIRAQDSLGWLPYNFARSGSVVNGYAYTSFPPTSDGSLEELKDFYAKNKWRDMWLQFQYGTNDAAQWDASGAVLATWKADYKAYIQQYIDAGFDKRKIIICTPPYSTASYPNGDLAQLIDPIREIAQELDIRLADFWQAMIDGGLDINTVAGGDDIHGDAAVHQLLFETIRVILEDEHTDVAGASASPGGTDGSIQYKDGSDFTGDNYLIRSTNGVRINTTSGNVGGLSFLGYDPGPNAFYFGDDFLMYKGVSGEGINFATVNETHTSGAKYFVKFSGLFTPSSGTGVYNNLEVAPEINQTGGANGITRGAYFNPTLTAAADWRSIEIANNSGHSIYQSGASALNYLNGRTAIGRTTSDDGTGAILQISTGISTNPADATRSNWLFGEVVTTTGLTFSTTQYVKVKINGVLYKLAIADLP